MRKLFTFSLVVLTMGLYAQEVEQDSILTQQLDEVVVTSRVIDVAKERVTPIAVSSISASDISFLL